MSGAGAADGSVQATVRRWDDATGAGDALRDDGLVVAFSADAFHAGGLRLLRPGQRVELRLRDGEVTRVGLPG